MKNQTKKKKIMKSKIISSIKPSLIGTSLFWIEKNSAAIDSEYITISKESKSN